MLLGFLWYFGIFQHDCEDYAMGITSLPAASPFVSFGGV
jgi:hypothetical protein